MSNEAAWSYDVLVDMGGVRVIVPIAVYACIFHHSVAVISEVR